MSHFSKSSSNVAKNSSHKIKYDDLVLEDTNETTETHLGSGNANILASGDKFQPVTSKEEFQQTRTNIKIQKQLTNDDYSRATKDKDSLKRLEGDVDTNDNLSVKESELKIAVKQSDKSSALPPIFIARKINPFESSKSSVVKVDVSTFPVLNQENHTEIVDECKSDRNLIQDKKVSLPEEVKAADKAKPKPNLRMKLELIKNGIGAKGEINEAVYSNSGENKSEAEIKDANVQLNALESTPGKSTLESGLVNGNSSADGEFVQLKEPRSSHNYSDPVPLELETARELKNLLLGSSSLVYADKWKYQGLSFSDSKRQQYGLIQKQIGPCGIVSVVQSFLLKSLLFTGTSKSSNRSLQPNIQEKTRALAAALANIFWQAGDKKMAVVTILGKKSHLDPVGIRTDGITEKILVISFENYENLLNYLLQNIDQYKCATGPGLILSIYSAILSRTVKKVYGDMDDPCKILIDAHGNCSQELINLFLMGHAVTNVFNDDVESRGCGVEQKVCKGIPARSDVGFLSVSECHRNSDEVGTYLKTPKYPIWLLKAENQFCVLFSTKKEVLLDWKAEKRFDLYLYSTIGFPDEEIRLTIDNTDPTFCPLPFDETGSFIELGIRTKWSQADIHWNGSESPAQWNRILDDTEMNSELNDCT